MGDGLNMNARPGEPENPFPPGMSGATPSLKAQPVRFVVNPHGMIDTSISGPVMLQQPPRWSHDWEPGTGNSRATLRSVVPVYENPPTVPTPPPGSSDTSTATTEFVDRAMQQAVLEAVQKAKIGVTNGFDAAPGEIGEFLSLNVPSPGPEIFTAYITNIGTLEIPPGDWDLNAVGVYSWTGVPPGPATYFASALGLTPDGFPNFPDNGGVCALSMAPGGAAVTLPIATRINTAAPLSLFLQAYAQFSIGRMYAYGFVGARRRR